MQTPEGLTIISVSHQDVLALLRSDALAAIENQIASQCGLRIIYDDSSASTSCTQAEISVCGMTTDQIEDYLNVSKTSLIDFGARFLNDDDATSDEQDPDDESEPSG